MSSPTPSFGQADLTNCEREPIHQPGSIQPHGCLLVLREADLAVLQASANTAALLGRSPAQLLGAGLGLLGGSLATQVQALAAEQPLHEPWPLACRVAWPAEAEPASGRMAGAVRPLHGWLHRVAAQQVLVLEFEPLAAPHLVDDDGVFDRLPAAVNEFGQAASIGALCDAVARHVRDLSGYGRVMVYKFDPDGHGKVIAEARDARLPSWLGHHYPATDIPQRARALYLSNRLRLLVDVDDPPVPLEPPRLPLPDGGAAELDMSMCTLRSMSPLHLQYMRNMDVTATLVVSLVREGQLWGLIAAHHAAPRSVGPALRAACDLLAEAAATRIAAIENYAYAQVGVLVRRLEQRLVEATSTEGDWRMALFRNPRTLLQPLEATGAALFHEGELLTSGEVPSTPELQALVAWVDSQYAEPPFASSSVGKANPALASLTPVASGVLAVRLAAARPDYLMWFRKEQLLTVTWAGDPAKPMVGDDPLNLSPRRSFAAWSEIVRGTAVPWSGAERAIARAIGQSLVDIIVQVNGVRLLVAEHQLAGIRSAVHGAEEPVAIADAQGRLLTLNPACLRLLDCSVAQLPDLDALAACFEQPVAFQQGLAAMRRSHQAWRGELALAARAERPGVPVAVRAEEVPGRDGQVLGLILTLIDVSEARRADAARRHLEASLAQAGRHLAEGGGLNEVVSAILTHASLAAMDIADSASGPGSAPLLEEVEASARRAAVIYARIRALLQQRG